MIRRNRYKVAHQRGHGLPVFTGLRYQRGHGLGNMLRALGKIALPVLKSGAKVLGKQALKTAAQVANDVASGAPIKKAVKKRVVQRVQKVTKRVAKPHKRKHTHKKRVSKSRTRKGAASKDALS